MNVSGVGDMEVSRISSVSGVDLIFPEGFSFFEPYLHYFTREALEIGGEAYVSRTCGGEVSGVFTYDDFEKSAAVYTRSREVFDYFWRLKPFNFLFSELKTEVDSEPFDIYRLDLENHEIVHRFTHEISMADQGQIGELERFMALAHPGMNRRWTAVALANGDKCFTVRLGGEIAGLGWVSCVEGVGRVHSLFVKPEFRKLGMGEDILFARLLWLKAKRSRSAFSEISCSNSPSSRIASKAQMKPCGQVFHYSRKSPTVSEPLKS